MVMTQTTIELPEEVLDRLRSIANERGTDVGEIIREVLEERTSSYPMGDRPKPRSIGIVSSGHTDLSVRAGNESIVPRPWS
jgi:hypothetical protein